MNEQKNADLEHRVAELETQVQHLQDILKSFAISEMYHEHRYTSEHIFVLSRVFDVDIPSGDYSFNSPPNPPTKRKRADYQDEKGDD